MSNSHDVVVLFSWLLLLVLTGFGAYVLGFDHGKVAGESAILTETYTPRECATACLQLAEEGFICETDWTSI